MPSTLLDFFKKLPSKKAEHTSPTTGDTAAKKKSDSPKENAQEFASKKPTKSNQNGDVQPASSKHVEALDEVKDEHAENGNSRKRSPCSDDEDLEDDEVTGRKVSSEIA